MDPESSRRALNTAYNQNEVFNVEGHIPVLNIMIEAFGMRVCDTSQLRSRGRIRKQPDRYSPGDSGSCAPPGLRRRRGDEPDSGAPPPAPPASSSCLTISASAGAPTQTPFVAPVLLESHCLGGESTPDRYRLNGTTPMTSAVAGPIA